MDNYLPVSGERRLDSDDLNNGGNPTPRSRLLPSAQVRSYLDQSLGKTYYVKHGRDADKKYFLRRVEDGFEEPDEDGRVVIDMMGLQSNQQSLVIGSGSYIDMISKETKTVLTNHGGVSPYVSRPSKKAVFDTNRKIVLTGGTCLFGGRRFVALSDGKELNAADPDERRQMLEMDPDNLDFSMNPDLRPYHRVLADFFGIMGGILPNVESAWYHVPEGAYRFTIGRFLKECAGARNLFGDHVEKIRGNMRSSLRTVNFYEPDPSMVALLTIASLMRNESLPDFEKNKLKNSRCVRQSMERAEYVAMYAETLLRYPEALIFNVDEFAETGLLVNVETALKHLSQATIREGHFFDYSTEYHTRILRIIEENYAKEVSMDRVIQLHREINDQMGERKKQKEVRIVGGFLVFPHLHEDPTVDFVHPYLGDSATTPPYPPYSR